MSINDPQWGGRGNDNGGGKRPNQGPPDLEDLWRDLNGRLSSIFDKKKGGGNNNNNANGKAQEKNSEAPSSTPSVQTALTETS